MKRTDIRTGITYGHQRSKGNAVNPVTVIDTRAWVEIASPSWRSPTPVDVTLEDGSTVRVGARLARGDETRTAGVLARTVTDDPEDAAVFVCALRHLTGEYAAATAKRIADTFEREERSRQDVERVAAREVQRARLDAAHPALRAGLRQGTWMGRLDFPRVEVDLDVLLALLHLDGPVDDRG